MARSRAALSTALSIAVFFICCLIAWSCLGPQLGGSGARADEEAVSQASEDQDEVPKLRRYLSASEATTIQIRGATSEDLEDQNQPEAAHGHGE